MSDLQFSVARFASRERVARVAVSGELDAHVAEDFGAELQDLSAPDIVDVEVDLSDLTFIDSTALRTLVELERTFRERGGSLRIVRPSPTVAQVLRIADLEQHFGVR